MKKKLVYLALSCAILLFIGQSYAEIDIETCVGAWCFDEGKGDVVRDSSGNGNDGNVVKSNWVKGEFGDAIEFTGTGYVEIPASESLNSIEDEITIVTWIKFIKLRNWGRIIMRGFYDDTNNVQFKLICTDQPEVINFALYSKGQWFTMDGQHVLEQDAWHHIAYTSDGVQLKLYADGVLKKSSGSGKSLNKPEDQSLFFGSGINAPGGAPGSAQKFQGALDEVALFNVALTEDDINNIMNNGILEAIGFVAVDPLGKLTTTWADLKK